jgi:hypothetical protein
MLEGIPYDSGPVEAGVKEKSGEPKNIRTKSSSIFPELPII